MLVAVGTDEKLLAEGVGQERATDCRSFRGYILILSCLGRVDQHFTPSGIFGSSYWNFLILCFGLLFFGSPTFKDCGCKLCLLFPAVF